MQTAQTYVPGADPHVQVQTVEVDAERRRYLSFERYCKAVSLWCLGGAITSANLLAITLFRMMTAPHKVSFGPGFVVGLFLLTAALILSAVDLRRIRPRGRWAATAIVVMLCAEAAVGTGGILAFLFALLWFGLVFPLWLSTWRTVWSDRYQREVLANTPHLTVTTPWWAWVAFAPSLLFALSLLAFIGIQILRS